jgi:hypothetical protein
VEEEAAELSMLMRLFYFSDTGRVDLAGKGGNAQKAEAAINERSSPEAAQKGRKYG